MEPACRARFWSYVHFLWQASHFRDILGSRTLFCVTGAGHRTLFHPRGRRGTFCMLAKILAGVSQNERLFWRSFFVAGAVFGEPKDSVLWQGLGPTKWESSESSQYIRVWYLFLYTLIWDYVNSAP